MKTQDNKKKSLAEKNENILRKAGEVFEIEAAGILQVKEQLGEAFIRLVLKCEETLNKGGKIVLSGVGKSGHIGKKIAATLSSLGSTAVFMHPVEALHGDLGILNERDILIALSYSGETEELLSIFPAVRRFDIPIAAITGFEDSRLGECCDIIVKMKVEKEACPFNLAPTTTAAALLAVGDALAICLLERRGFTKEDYGRLHPGGAIGRAVTLHVRDIMRKGNNIAFVSPDTSVKETLFEMTRARSGSAVIIDERRHLLGIFTDGDLRRHIEHNVEILSQPIKNVMTENPLFLYDSQLAVDALKLIEKRRIDDIVVINENNEVVGIVDSQDLPSLKLM